MPLFYSTAAPPWLRTFGLSIERTIREIWPAPLKLWRAASADLPAAADYTGALAYDSASLRITYSDGTRWNALQPRSSGTAFPGSPASGDVCYRTDRGIEYRYDGTRWLSTQLFAYPISLSDALNPRTASQTGLGRGVNPWAGLYDLFVLDAVFQSYITATSTWTLSLLKIDGPTIVGTLASRTTASDPLNSHVSNRVAVNSVVSNAIDYFDLQVALSSGASSLYCSAAITYRLVG